MDYPIANHAKVNVLLVPVNASFLQFQRYKSLLFRYNEVRLLDITPNTSLNYFNPQLFPSGKILFNYITHPSDTLFLQDFDPHRKTFIVIGIGKYEENNEGDGTGTGAGDTGDAFSGSEIGLKGKKTDLEEYNDSIKLHDSIELHDSISLSQAHKTTENTNSRPLKASNSFFSNKLSQLKSLYPSSPVHSIILFDTPKKLNHDSIYFHEGETSTNITLLETILCDISLKFLIELDFYASSYSNITLRSPVSIINSHTLTKAINQAKKRLNSFNNLNIDLKSNRILKHSGRQLKLFGNFYLISGNYLNSFNHFIESLSNLKKSDDFLWLGSSLEGLAISIILLQYSGTNFDLPKQKLCQILQISSKKLSSLTPDTTTSDFLQTNSPRSSISTIKSPRNSISSHSSITDVSNLALPELIKLILSKALQYYQLSTEDYENMVPDVVYVDSILRLIKFMVSIHLGKTNGSLLNNISKDCLHFLMTDILKEINKIYSLQLTGMSILEQCRIYCTLAQIYSDLGLHRKRAFILKLLLVQLIPKLEDENLEIDGSVIIDGFNLHQKSHLREIFTYLFKIYDVSLNTKSSITWTTIQIPILKLGLKVSELVKDYEFGLTICSTLLSNFTECLAQDVQQSLKDKMDSLLYNLDAGNSSLHLNYWDRYLVRNAKIVHDNGKDDFVSFLEYSKGSGDVGLVGSNESSKKFLAEPFFDPYNQKKKSPIKELTLIKGETYYVKAQLQNKFQFPIEIEEITVETEGNNQVATLSSLTKTSNTVSKTKLRNPKKSMNTINDQTSNMSSSLLIIPPQSLELFQIAFDPIQVGDINIIGFKAKVSGCKNQYFPIYENIMTPKADNKLGVERDDIKLETKVLSFKVIPPQPNLCVVDLSIPNSWAMLLEGEEHKFSITLTNYSTEFINFLSFSFWDSTIETLTKRLNSSSGNQTLPANEIHELEYLLMKSTPFKIINKDEIITKYQKIGPKQDLKIDFEIIGKRGMKQLKVILEYAYKDVNDLQNSFVKTVQIPIKLSIFPSFDIISCNIIPLSWNEFDDEDNKDINNITQFIKSVKDSDYCLMVLDLKNLWNEELSIELGFKASNFKVQAEMKPHRTHRFILPIKRVSIDDVDVTAPIPSLRNKQFIKDYSITETEEKSMREQFWIRNHLLHNLIGTWKLNKSKKGNIEFRSFRVTSGMVNVIMYEKITITNEILQDDQSLIGKHGNIYKLKIDEFYTIKTTIFNDTNQDITGILRQLPFSTNLNLSINSIIAKSQISIERKILINGVLQQHLQEGIKSGHKREILTSFVLLERGDYEWGSIVDIGNLKYVCRQPLIINAV